MADTVLALNAGSSSIKFALFEIGPNDEANPISRGQVEGIGNAPHFLARDPSGAILSEQRWPHDTAPSHKALIGILLDWVDHHLGADRLVAVGHRVVHGGSDHRVPERVTDRLLDALDRLTPLAPLHQPHSLSPIRAIAEARPGLVQVACFDTAYHRTMPPVATRLALPRRYEHQGLRRYGFHGLSYEYIAGRLATDAPALAAGRVIVAHLGNGASLCAMRHGRSLDTTMGFTALDGLVMGTRCGSIDPGVLLYLQQSGGLSLGDLEDLLYRRSGLLGVSGIDSDMRTLLGSRTEAAREAVELFVYRFIQQAGAMLATLGGLDGLVFTAGIGEHAPEIRTAVCAKLAWLGIALDEELNRAGKGRISMPQSRVEIWVIPTDEEAMIARHTIATLQAKSHGRMPEA
ncbi:acetate/propionate family kinase [Lichenicoccus sp.]|uniref:acetate/propionate family kinase n=1 Tax=Lichenicoccus sp. TaxID=2781899 RepID=UPI003D0C5163